MSPNDTNSSTGSRYATLLVGPDFREFDVLAPYLEPGLDTHHIIKDSLTIDDVRTFIARALTRPVTTDEAVFIIAARTINHEAQHALLKILEEPPNYARIFLVVPHSGHLLPTVRSRLAVGAVVDAKITASKEFDAFLSLSYSERIALVGEKTKAKDIEWMDTLASDAEAYAALHAATNSDIAKVALAVAGYRLLRGASQKMLLEELALTIGSPRASA